jgi:precorrin-8X/cobalt-precorrin-8 methylmutase
MEYLREPAAIYQKSFSIIRAEAGLSHLPADAEAVAVRIIHACGMVEIAAELVISETFVAAAKRALAERCTILVDVEMVRHGIIARFLRGQKIICTLNDPQAREIGIAAGTTRSAAAVELWRDHLSGSVVVIGNAPTALFRLLELIDDGVAKPAAIIAFPVGFVGAAESKQALIENSRGIPFATLRGRKGGSAMAAAAVNGLLDSA